MDWNGEESMAADGVRHSAGRFAQWADPPAERAVEAT